MSMKPASLAVLALIILAPVTLFFSIFHFLFPKNVTESTTEMMKTEELNRKLSMTKAMGGARL